MEIAHNYQIKYSSLSTEQIDVFIASCGNDSRSIFLSQQLTIPISNKTIFCSKINASKSQNSKILKEFKKLGFSPLSIDDNSLKEIDIYLDTILQTRSKPELNIVIDYTSMPGSWYSAIINYFLKKDIDIYKVQLFFSYSPPKYFKSSKAKTIPANEPVLNTTYANGNANKPTALVLGLGYEKRKVKNMYGDMKPRNLFAFYPDATNDRDSNITLRKNNADLLKNIRGDKIIRYPSTNVEKAYSILSSVCMDLRLNHKVVIAPFGPKPFSLNSHLLAAQYPDIQVLNLTQNKRFEEEANGEFIINKVVFCNPDDWDKF